MLFVSYENKKLFKFVENVGLYYIKDQDGVYHPCTKTLVEEYTALVKEHGSWPIQITGWPEIHYSLIENF